MNSCDFKISFNGDCHVNTSLGYHGSEFRDWRGIQNVIIKASMQQITFWKGFIPLSK